MRIITSPSELDDIKEKQFGFVCVKCGKFETVNNYKPYRKPRFSTMLCRHCSFLHSNDFAAAVNKRKEYYLQHYGVDNPMKVPEIANKLKQSFTDKYGVDNPMKVPEIVDRLKRVFVDNYGVDNPMKVPEIVDNFKQYFIDNYGVDNPSKIPEVRRKAEDTTEKRYGVKYYTQSPDYNVKCKETCIDKYGVEHFSKNDVVKQHVKDGFKRVYGVAHSPRYVLQYYDGQLFDSKYELAVFIFFTYYGQSIIRDPIKDGIVYVDGLGKEHRYFPDFLINGKLVEIKGKQFFSTNCDTLVNPFDHNFDDISDCKYRCMLENNVEIWSNDVCEYYVNYIENLFGKGYLDTFKIDNVTKLPMWTLYSMTGVNTHSFDWINFVRNNYVMYYSGYTFPWSTYDGRGYSMCCNGVTPFEGKGL